MRFHIFIPLILCDLFCLMALISTLMIGPTWEFILSLAGVIVFTITSIIAGRALIREENSSHGH